MAVIMACRQMLMWLPSPSNYQQKSSGFTLIELLVTASLTLVMVGGALAAYNTFNTQQTHVQLARNVIANFEQAKKKSNVGDKPDDCNQLEGYRVQANADSSSYFVSIICDDGQIEESKQYTLSTDFSFDNAFEVLFRPYPYDVADTVQVIDLVRSGSDQVYRFTVSQTGTIEDLGLVSE